VIYDIAQQFANHDLGGIDLRWIIAMSTEIVDDLMPQRP
jgi:hypothetical protein